MSKVITFSRTYPNYHPRAGEPTYFVEQIWNGFRDDYFALSDDYIPFVQKYVRLKAVGEPLHFGGVKHHTIRAGHRWKAGDWFSPRVWSGRPYNSKQIQFAPDIQIKKTWPFMCDGLDGWFMDGRQFTLSWSERLAMNDGLTLYDMQEWFNKPLVGQIICWNESIEY